VWFIRSKAFELTHLVKPCIQHCHANANYNNEQPEIKETDGPISTHADPTSTPSHDARFYERHISSVTFTSVHLYGNVYVPVGVACALAASSDVGLLGNKVHKNVRVPALDGYEPPCKI